MKFISIRELLYILIGLLLCFNRWLRSRCKKSNTVQLSEKAVSPEDETFEEFRDRKVREGRTVFWPVTAEEGWTLGIAIEGIHGYYATDYGSVVSHVSALSWADELNARRGISHEQAVEIVTSTMGGNGRTP